MLRIWQAGSGGRLTWRASVESPHTGERQAFANLQALCAFLHDRLGEDATLELSVGNCEGVDLGGGAATNPTTSADSTSADSGAGAAGS